MCLMISLFWGISLVFLSGKLDFNPIHTGNSTKLVLPLSVSVTPVPDPSSKQRLTVCSKDQYKDMVPASNNF